MIVRKLFYGALMFVVGAAFTLGLAAALQQRATMDVPSYQPGAPAQAATGKRSDEQWMF